jgi:hypothetical protein
MITHSPGHMFVTDRLDGSTKPSEIDKELPLHGSEKEDGWAREVEAGLAGVH